MNWQVAPGLTVPDRLYRRRSDFIRRCIGTGLTTSGGSSSVFRPNKRAAKPLRSGFGSSAGIGVRAAA